MICEELSQNLIKLSQKQHLPPAADDHAVNSSPFNKMAAISQTVFSHTLEFQFKFHWNLFLRVQLTISQHWLR